MAGEVILASQALGREETLASYRAAKLEWQWRIDTAMPFLRRIEMFYPPKWLVKGDKMFERVGISGLEVGIHHLREMGFLEWPVR